MSKNNDFTEFDWPKTSTHFNNWLLDSPETLKNIQTKTYTTAFEKLKYKHPNVKIPSLVDELWLIKYYSYQLSRFLSNNNLKTSVKETSLSLFNRFYLRRSLIEYDPRIIMFTCITLATKLEDMWRSVYVDKLLGSLEDLDISKVFEMECVVCDGLNFNLFILHTADSLYIIIQHLIEYLKETLEVDDSNFKQHLNIILNILKQAENNSVIMHENPEFLFLYTPSQIALANAIYYIKTTLSSILSIDLFILKKFLDNNDKYLSPLMNKLNHIMDKYDEFIKVRNDFNLLENKEKGKYWTCI